MSDQMELFQDDKSLSERYEMWKEKNKPIVRAFFAFADAAARKQRKFGAKMISERLRWFTMIESDGDDYKVNNNWTSFLIRDWQKARPFYEHLVETRKQTHA